MSIIDKAGTSSRYFSFMVNVVDGFWNSSAQSANRPGNATQFLCHFRKNWSYRRTRRSFHAIITCTNSPLCAQMVILLHFCSSSNMSSSGVFSPNLRSFSPTVFNVLESWYVAPGQFCCSISSSVTGYSPKCMFLHCFLCGCFIVLIKYYVACQIFNAGLDRVFPATFATSVCA